MIKISKTLELEARRVARGLIGIDEIGELMQGGFFVARKDQLPNGILIGFIEEKNEKFFIFQKN